MIDELVKNSGLAEEFLEEGCVEGMREIVQSILDAHFGPLTPDMLAALKQADESTLRTLGIRAGTESLEQIRHFLKLV